MRCKSILRDRSQENPPDTSEAHQRDLPGAERRPADAEMVRVLKTAPVRMASDPSSGAAIAHWKHGALHDVVEPMADHVVMTYPTGVQRLERRNGKSAAIGTARAGVVNESIVSIAAELGYSSQTAFAAAFRKLTGETPSDWRRRRR